MGPLFSFMYRPCESRARTSLLSPVIVVPSASVCKLVIFNSAVYALGFGGLTGQGTVAGPGLCPVVLCPVVICPIRGIAKAITANPARTLQTPACIANLLSNANRGGSRTSARPRSSQLIYGYKL
jgi:hypothetical protein